MTAITLHQQASLTMPALKKYIINTLVAVSPVGERIPYESQDQLSQTAPYISNLPTPTLRHVNEAGQEISADFAQISNALSIYDNTIKFDPVIEMQKNMVQNVRQSQVDWSTKAMAYQIVNDYINGNSLTDSRAFDGLRQQLQENPRFYGQVVNASGNSTEVSLLPGSVTDAQAQGFLFKLTALDLTVDPVYSPDQTSSEAYITTGTFIITIAALLRQLKLWNVDKDQFDRKVGMFNGVPFLDAGFTPAGAVTGSIPAGGSQGNQVIGNDSESCSTTNGAFAYTNQTPIYKVRFGRDYQMGVQLQGLEVKDWQETTTPYYKSVQIRWIVNSAATWQKRAISRLVGFSPTGVTS